MRTIERNGDSKLKQKLPTLANRHNGIKADVVDFVVVIYQLSYACYQIVEISENNFYDYSRYTAILMSLPTESQNET